MKPFLHCLTLCCLFMTTTLNSYSQCDSGSLPAVFQFETCCVGSVNNIVSYTVYNDAEEIVLQEVANISGAPAVHSFELCLPEGCYYTTLSYSAGFTTSEHLQNFAVIGENTSSFNVFQTSNNIPFSFGFCVTGAPITCQAAFDVTVEDNGVISVVNNSTPTDGFTNLFGWEYGDESNVQGFDPNHTYSANGVYEVCLFQALYDGDIPVCVSEFCQTIEMNTVPNNSGCPTNVITYVGELCGLYAFLHNGEELGTNYWFVDEAFASNNIQLEQNFMEAGLHQICVAHVSATCESSATICTNLTTPDCTNSLCPSVINVEQTGCHTYVFHLNNLGNFGNITWDFGDGETSGGQNNVTHTFDSLGVYTICATAFGTYCQDGVEICYSLVVEPCGGPIENCSGTLYHTVESSCGHIHFEAGNLPEGTEITWNFGDGSSITSTANVLDHTYQEPGIYTAVAMVAWEGCPNNLTLYTVITIPNCFPQDECPDGIFAGPAQNCSIWNFEIGSASPGESVVWNFGDGQIITGGHFTTHTFEANGIYEVCGLFTSNNCPDGVEFCTTVEVDCGLDCTLEIEQLPTSCGLAIFQANININFAEIHWSFDGSTSSLNGSVVTVEATDGVYPICAWYDSEACFTAIETCAEVVIDNCDSCTELTFGFDSFVNDGGTTSLNWAIYNANNMAQIESGVAQYSVNDPYYDEMICLEDGCYVVTATNNEPFNLQAVIPNFGPTANIISIDSMNSAGNYGYEILISINGNCEADCDIVGFNFASYPSFGGMPIVNWQLTNSSNQLISSGSNDFAPMEVPQFYYDCLEEDCYTLVFTGAQQFEGNSNFTNYFSGNWVINSIEYGDNGEAFTKVVHLSVNSNCAPEQCVLELNATELEPGLFEFTAIGNPEVYPMFWDFGDGESLEATWVTMHAYPEPGAYTICAHIQTDACGIVEACTTVIVQEQNLCNYAIWSGPGNDCGDFIFEIAGGSVLGPIIWNFGNEIVTDNQSLMHHFDEPGTYTVTASGSSEACPNFSYSTIVVVPECEICTPASFVFSSNVLDGGTDCVAMNLTNLVTNESSSELFEFTGNIMTHEWNNCLADGCYSLSFDSCLPISAGNGLGYDIFVNGLSVLDQALITYQDNYAMTITFGINSDCVNTACEAYFEVTTATAPGEILLNNLSTIAGDASYSWDFGNDDIQLGNPLDYFYMQNGTYEICLTASNNLCSDTHCASVDVTNSLCSYNGVLVNITSDFQMPNMTDDLTVMVTIEDAVIGEYILTVEPFNTYPLEFCLPTGCYNIDLVSNEPLSALGIFANVVTNNNIVAEAEILAGSFYGGAEFGINVNCEDYQNEVNTSPWKVYPNPADDMLNWNLSSNESITSIKLLDAYGKLIRSINPEDQIIDVSSFSSGLYFLQMDTPEHRYISKIQINH